jgi:hypothetical protein
MTPDVTLFLRSYHGDAHWVVELMRSIDRWVKIGTPDGFRELVVHVDPQDVEIFRPIIGARGRIVSSEPWTPNGYLSQQCAKLASDMWTRSSYTLFLDSDYHFCGEARPETFFIESRPQILMTKYSDLAGTVPWQATVEKIAKESVVYEYMRGAKICYPRETFPALRTWIMQNHGAGNPLKWLTQFPQLSEYNLVGWFAHKFMRDRIVFSDTSVTALPWNPIKQYWSRGGITPSIRTEIEADLA